MNGCGCVANKTLFTETSGSSFWPTDHSLLTHRLESRMDEGMQGGSRPESHEGGTYMSG